MFKAKKFVSFVTNKDGVMKIIETLSAYGVIKTHMLKDRKTYMIGVPCNPDDLSKCLDSILMMSGDGVWIRHMNIKWSLGD